MAGWTTDTTTAAEIAAAIAGSADQITQLNALANALGTGPRTMTVKNAVSGDPWEDGTIVNKATLTGPNVILSGMLRPGTVTAMVEGAAANMSIGQSVVRFENASGRFVQLPIATAAQAVNIPRNPTGLFAMVMGDTFGIAADPSLAPAPDAQVSTVTLHNETAGAQAANFVTPFFGAQFKQGEIPVGSYPHFRLMGGQSCPATLTDISSWPDGSMKACGVLMQVPASVPAMSTLTVQVRSGGVAPAASARTTADLTAADIKVELVGVDGLTGTWVATLNDAIATGADIQLRGAGPAGSVWCIGGEVRDSGNAAHGQLYAWHYVAALSNADGTFKGLLYLGRVAQPWMNALAFGAPPPRHRDCTATLMRGTTVIRNLTGMAGSETISNTIRILHSASIFTAGLDGKWDFIQGGGSDSAGPVVRVTVDVPHVIEAGLVPPYEMTTTVSAYPNVDYVANGMGACGARDMSGTGERPDIGLVPNWSVRHLILQDASHERAVRVTSLIGSGWRHAFYNRETKKLAPFAAARASYPTLGPIRSTWRTSRDHLTGPDIPVVNESLWVEDQGHQSSAHYWAFLFTGEPQNLDLQFELGAKSVSRPAPATRAYNLTMPITSSSLITADGERNVKIGSHPVRYGAVACLISNGMRDGGWALRDLAEAAAIGQDGSEVTLYMRDCVANSVAALLDFASDLPYEFQKQGIFQFERRGDRFEGSSSPWHRAFFDWAIAHCAAILPTSEALAVRAYCSKNYEARNTHSDMGLISAYRDHWWEGPTFVGMPKVGYQTKNSYIDFVAATGRGTVRNDREDAPLVNVTRWVTWTPAENDILTFGVEDSPDRPNPDMFKGERCYVKNVSGRSFEISRTPGGPAISIPADVSINYYFVNSKSCAPSPSYGSNYEHYSNIIQCVLVMLKPHHPNVQGAYDSNMVYINSFLSKGLSFANQPKYRLQFN